MGEYKLVNDVSEIWTHVPHIQGVFNQLVTFNLKLQCARRCIENEAFSCQSFSYEATKEICLLSKIADNPAVLFEHMDSRYYRRKFTYGMS
jgi:hypothetical protein